MNRELVKTIILTFLVFLSIGLTWNIWFFQSDYKNNKGPTASLEKNVSIAESRNLSDVVIPNLVITHQGQQVYGQSQAEAVAKVYSLFQQGKFTDVFPLSGSYNGPKRGGNDSYEIIFPAPVTISALQKLFDFNSEPFTVKENLLIDRIEVFKPVDEKGMTAVFRTSNDSAAFYTTVINVDMKSLEKAVNNDDLISYSPKRLKHKKVYLPAEKTVVHSVLRYYKSISFSDFAKVLFSNPDNAIYSKGATTYSDSGHQLEKNGDILQYVNLEVSERAEDIADPILNSYNFIDGHKGWTDDFMYDDLAVSTSSQKQEVNFRMRIGNIPVFNTEVYPKQYLARIDVIWKNGELNKLNRTLINLSPIDVKDPHTLESGKEVLQLLRENGSVLPKDIDDLQIGYRLKLVPDSNTTSNTTVELMPDWFYSQGGRWSAVSDLIKPKNQLQEGADKP